MSTGVITYGRFQPPHLGHEKLINKVLEIRNGLCVESSAIIFTSRSYNEDNPIEEFEKCTMLRTIHDDVRPVGLMFEALSQTALSHKDLIFVIGDDRMEHFTNIIHRYNGSPAYKFDSIQMVSAGSREDERWSGTYMRELARRNDVAAFMALCPSTFTPDMCRASWASTRAIGALYQ